MKPIRIVIGIGVFVLLLSSFLIQTTPKAPMNTRMIVDHTYGVYIAPPCFNDAEVTNYLEETTLGRAIETGYEPESICTENSLTAENQPWIYNMFEKIGFIQGKWDRDGEWK
ncbi:hypothetical protein [Alkalihalobacillus sp. LMS39]|uniref:hypothetical protein n=1 Tax=Alkalihalobacillus sp. LMS39 TaxID=2924032 RepID=UPI001FB323D2|nr:hypothetical protein [Alkalihalobacillus sp. LMS39]UOE96009.1 hypothetical protein MM271_10575 [Alkalihalobacillus sp. LMS39]